jgi:hypothetical protein
VIVAVELDEARALDVLGDVAPWLRWADRIAAAAQDQRRNPDLGQKRADIDRQIHAIQLGRRRRARPRALVRRPTPCELVVAARREARRERQPTPHPGDLVTECVPLLLRKSPGVVRLTPKAGLRAEQDEAEHAFRMRGRE